MPIDLGQQRLDLLQSISILPKSLYTPETYYRRMLVQGGSIQSTLFVESIDPGATLDINFKQFTTGLFEFEPTVGQDEVVLLNNHAQVTDALVAGAGPDGYTEQITVTGIHDKPYIEAVVTGGNARFGVYLTVKSQFASDTDASLVRDGDTFFPNTTRAIPIACLDETTGTVGFVRCRNGLLGFTSDVGEPFKESGTDTTTPQGTVDVVDFTVATGFERNLSRATISTFETGVAKLTVGGVLFGTARVGPGQYDAIIELNPSQTAIAGQQVKLTFTATDTGITSRSCDIEGFVYGSEITV